MAYGVRKQDMVSFRARLDDHHVLLTNQSAGAYYVGVYNNDNYMKARGRPTSQCFATAQSTQGGQHVDGRQACTALATVFVFLRSVVPALPNWPFGDAGPAHTLAAALPSCARDSTGTVYATGRVLMRVKEP